MERKAKNYLDIRILGLEILSDSGDSASASNSHNEDVDLSISVLPYLGTSGFKMHLSFPQDSWLITHEPSMIKTNQPSYGLMS